MGSDLYREVLDNYRKVVEHQNRIGFDSGVGSIWTGNFPAIAQILNNSKSGFDLIDQVDQTTLYSVNFPAEEDRYVGKWARMGDSVRVRERQIRWVLDKQASEGVHLFSMPERIQESPVIHHRNQVLVNGRIMSGNFLRNISMAERVFSRVSLTDCHRILELGGGCGHLARVFGLLVPNLHYTIIDLPETLIFSYTFLRLNFPDKKILFVTSDEEAKDAEEYDFALFPVVFSKYLEGSTNGLFVNTASLGEMTNETIRHWMDFIQNKITLKYLFTLNRYLNVVDERLAGWRKNQNECSVSYDNRWEILRWELEPSYQRCPYVDSVCSRCLEILARRLPAPINPIERSRSLCEEILDEDWYRLTGMYNGGLMLMLGGPLALDLSMSGTLFKLWESIRLAPNRTNVALMIEYLSTLPSKGGTFEELYYYRDLLSRLS